MSKIDKPLLWLHGEIKSPPLSSGARMEAGYFLRRLQQNENIGMPHSRPMPGIGKRCHELRIVDKSVTWRIIYRTDTDAVVILAVFNKKTKTTPKRVLEVCRQRIRFYDDESN